MKNTLLTLLSFLSILVHAQNERDNLRAQADSVANAVLKGDYVTLARYTYPNLLEEAGGKDEFILMIKDAMDKMYQQGIRILSVTIGEPSAIVKAESEIHCIVPQSIVLKVPKGKMYSDSYLLAISKNNGKQWYFIDVGDWTEEEAAAAIPNYNSDLKIPALTKPVFVND